MSLTMRPPIYLCGYLILYLSTSVGSPRFEFTAALENNESRFKFGDEDSLSVYGLPIDTVKVMSNELALFDNINIADKLAFFVGFHVAVCELQKWINFALHLNHVSEDLLGAFCTVTLQEFAFAFRAYLKKWVKLRDGFYTWVTALLPY